MAHCASFDGTRHTVTTPSGNVVGTFHGDASFEDYDADGNLVSSMESTNRMFDLLKVYDDGIARIWVHHDAMEQRVDSPWGFSAWFSIRELFIDGEWVYQVVDAEFSDDPC